MTELHYWIFGAIAVAAFVKLVPVFMNGGTPGNHKAQGFLVLFIAGSYSIALLGRFAWWLFAPLFGG